MCLSCGVNLFYMWIKGIQEAIPHSETQPGSGFPACASSGKLRAGAEGREQFPSCTDSAVLWDLPLIIA